MSVCEQLLVGQGQLGVRVSAATFHGNIGYWLLCHMCMVHMSVYGLFSSMRELIGKAQLGVGFFACTSCIYSVYDVIVGVFCIYSVHGALAGIFCVYILYTE